MIGLKAKDAQGFMVYCFCLNELEIHELVAHAPLVRDLTNLDVEGVHAVFIVYPEDVDRTQFVMDELQKLYAAPDHKMPNARDLRIMIFSRAIITDLQNRGYYNHKFHIESATDEFIVCATPNDALFVEGLIKRGLVTPSTPITLGP